MPDSVQGSPSGGTHFSAASDSSSARYHPAYDRSTCLRGYKAFLDTAHFSNLSSTRAARVVLFETDSRGTTAGACRKRWKNWYGGGALHLQPF